MTAHPAGGAHAAGREARATSPAARGPGSLLCCAGLVALFSCHGPAVGTGTGAATMTAVAVGAAAYERSQGGCIAVCTNGTICNGKTGLCEVLPCRGRCGEEEHCEVTFTESKCVAGAAGGVTAQAPGTKAPAPAVVPVTPPNTSSAAPTIVPTAEQQPPKGN